MYLCFATSDTPYIAVPEKYKSIFWSILTAAAIFFNFVSTEIYNVNPS